MVKDPRILCGKIEKTFLPKYTAICYIIHKLSKFANRVFVLMKFVELTNGSTLPMITVRYVPNIYIDVRNVFITPQIEAADFTEKLIVSLPSYYPHASQLHIKHSHIG